MKSPSFKTSTSQRTPANRAVNAAVGGDGAYDSPSRTMKVSARSAVFLIVFPCAVLGSILGVFSALWIAPHVSQPARLVVFLLIPIGYLAGLLLGKYLASRALEMSRTDVERNLL